MMYIKCKNRLAPPRAGLPVGVSRGSWSAGWCSMGSGNGYVPVVDVTVAGLDVGARRLVAAFIGTRAALLHDLVIVYGRQNGVSFLPLGVFNAVTKAFVVDVGYPGVDKYRGEELSNNVVGKALGALVRALHSVRNLHGGVVGIVLEDLRLFGEYKRDLLKARAVWDLVVRMLGDGREVCPVVRSSWFWLTFKGGLLMRKDGISLVFVEPEYSSQVCPRCGRYLSRGRGVMTCGFCGFEGDRDVIGAINVAWRGFLITMKCIRECVLRVSSNGGWGLVLYTLGMPLLVLCVLPWLLFFLPLWLARRRAPSCRWLVLVLLLRLWLSRACYFRLVWLVLVPLPGLQVLLRLSLPVLLVACL